MWYKRSIHVPTLQHFFHVCWLLILQEAEFLVFTNPLNNKTRHSYKIPFIYRYLQIDKSQNNKVLHLQNITIFIAECGLFCCQGNLCNQKCFTAMISTINMMSNNHNDDPWPHIYVSSISIYTCQQLESQSMQDGFLLIRIIEKQQENYK